MEGEIIKFAKDIENGQYYVAASNEQFDNIKYGQYLPAIRAGKVPPKSEYNAESSRQKPVTSRNQKKEKDEKDAAAIKIQAAFRGYYLRKQLQSAQENNEPIPHSTYRYEPKIVKPRTKPIKPIKTGNEQVTKVSTQNSKERYHSVERKVEVKENKVEKKNESTITKEVSKKEDKVQERKIQKERKEEVKEEEKKKEIKKQAEKRQTGKEKPNIKERKEGNTSDNSIRRNLAAATIQAGYRSYIARQLSDVNQRTTNSNDKSETIKSVGKNEIKDGKIKEKDNVEEKQNDSNINKKKERENAAIKIQMGFRGYKARKTMKEREEAAKVIQLHDKDYIDRKEKAATVIQSGFRGYKTRKYMSDKNENEKKEKAAGTIQAYFRGNKSRNSRRETTARNNAAITIQAAFKGYRVRDAIKQ